MKIWFSWAHCHASTSIAFSFVGERPPVACCAELHCAARCALRAARNTRLRPKRSPAPYTRWKPSISHVLPYDAFEKSAVRSASCVRFLRAVLACGSCMRFFRAVFTFCHLRSSLDVRTQFFCGNTHPCFSYNRTHALADSLLRSLSWVVFTLGKKGSQG